MSDVQAGSAGWTDVVQTLWTDRRGLASWSLENIRRMLTAARNALPCAEAGLLVPVSEGGPLRFLLSVNSREGVWEILADCRIPPDRSIAGYVLATGMPLAISNPEDYDQQVDQKTGIKTKFYMALPVIAQGEPLGVVTFLNRPDGSPLGKFQADELMRCQQFASLLAVCLRLHFRAQRLAELFEAELAEAVRTTQPQLAALVDPAPVEESERPLGRALRALEVLSHREQALAAELIEVLAAHQDDRNGDAESGAFD